MRLANCCQPIPGDPIMGYITRGKGVTIHRADCPYLASTETFRHIPAEWDGAGGGNKLYPVKIQVVTVDKPGLLADITSALKGADVNVTKASVETTAENKGVAQFHHSGGGPEPPGKGLRRPEAFERSDFRAAADGVGEGSGQLPVVSGQ